MLYITEHCRTAGDDEVQIVSCEVRSKRTVTLRFPSDRYLTIRTQEDDLTIVVVIEDVGSFLLPAHVHWLEEGFVITRDPDRALTLSDHQVDILEYVTVQEVMLHGHEVTGEAKAARSVSLWGTVDLDAMGGLRLRSKDVYYGVRAIHVSFQGTPRQNGVENARRSTSRPLEIEHW